MRKALRREMEAAPPLADFFDIKVSLKSQ